MASVLKLLWKIFIRSFYIVNAGFFLFAFILIFGIAFPPQLILIHESLIYGIIQSNFFTTIVLLLWLLYNLKCIFFCLRIINKEDDSILFNLQAISPARQWMLLLVCHIVLYMPVIIYSCFVIGTSYHEGFILYSLVLILFQLLMCAVGVYTYYMNINFTWRMHARFRLSVPVSNIFDFKKTFSLYLIYHTFYLRKMVFFLLKFISLFLLNMILVKNDDHFMIRDFMLVFMIIISIHSLLVYYYVEFMEKMISFSRNLPISRLKRFLLFTFTYSLILLPELVFIITNAAGFIPVLTIFVFYGLAISELLLFTSSLYIIRMKMKPYLQIVFSIFLLLSILTLSGSYIAIFIANMCIAFIVFNRKYYKYEVEW